MSKKTDIPSAKAANWAKKILRRNSIKWGESNKALREAFIRKEGRKYIYRCASCKGEFTRKEVHRDHIDPVVPIEKLITELTVDEYCARLLPESSGYQILCISCHDNKTQAENSQRKKKYVKKTKKPSKKSTTKKNRLGGSR